MEVGIQWQPTTLQSRGSVPGPHGACNGGTAQVQVVPVVPGAIQRASI